MIKISTAFIERLERLSDYKRLKYEWLDNQEGIVSSFDEDYYSLFWSTGVAMSLEENDIVFGPEIDTAVSNLQRMVEDLYGYSYREDKILTLPQMDAIRGEAARIAKILRQPNPNEGVTFLWEFFEEKG